MYAFLLSFILFYTIVVNRYDTDIKPALSNLSTNKILLPSRLIDLWLLVTATLFPLNAVMRARKSNFDMEQSLSFMALIFGVLLGMVADTS